MKTKQAERIIEMAASRVAYWDPRIHDWGWRSEPIEPDWDDGAAEWDAIVLAAGKQRALRVASDDDPEYEVMLIDLWNRGYVVVDSREALHMLPLWAETIFVGTEGRIRRMEMFVA